MTINQKKEKLDKRAKALRENLRKRRPVKKSDAKTETKDKDEKD